MEKKSDIVRSAASRGDWKRALRIAKDFRIGLSPTDRDAMARAYECMVHPEFYRQIGKDLDAEIEKGKDVLERRVLAQEGTPIKAEGGACV